MIRFQLNLEMNLIAEQAALDALERIYKELKLHKRELEKDTDLLNKKYTKIKQLEQQIEQRQLVMTTLTKLNMQERRGFSIKREEIINFIEEQLDPIEKILKQLQMKLERYIVKELELFNRIDINNASLSNLHK